MKTSTMVVFLLVILFCFMVLNNLALKESRDKYMNLANSKYEIELFVKHCEHRYVVIQVDTNDDSITASCVKQRIHNVEGK